MKADIFDTMKHEFNKLQNKIIELQYENLDLLRRIQALETRLNNSKVGIGIEDRDHDI